MICNGFNVGTHWVVGKCISRCMIFVFQCAWIPNLINIYVICKFVLCFVVAVYFYWFYMCRHCSLSCEIHLVNNMTMFWNVNFIFLVSHFIWKHCSKMCMYKCNPCWASNVDNQKKKILLLFCRLLFNVLYCLLKTAFWPLWTTCLHNKTEDIQS